MPDCTIQDHLRYFEGDYHYPHGLLTQAAETIDALRDALQALKTTARDFPCWCDYSHDVREHGHQPKCARATAALTDVISRSDDASNR
jgi:hypothetical protein